MAQVRLFALVFGLFAFVFFLSTMGKPVDRQTGTEVASGSSFGENLYALFGLQQTDLAGRTIPTEPKRDADFYGWNVWYPTLMMEGDSLAFVTDAVADYPRRSRDVFPRPARYSIIKPNAVCAPKPPEAGAVIANISINGGGGGSRHAMLSDLHVFSTAQFAKDGSDWLDQSLRKSAFDPPEKLTPPHRMPIVDVILNDTSGPLYVVLQNRFANGVLWNVVPAPGVEIAHIAMIGPKVALNPPPGEYEIEWLPSGAEGCTPRVARNPKPFWDMYHRPMGADDLAEYEAEEQQRYYTYNAWFNHHFGVGSEDRVVGFNSGNHLLWGSMPETPIPYRPVAGADVIVGEADFIFAAPEAERLEFLTELHMETLNTAAGGELAFFFPEPMTREAVQ